MLFSDELIALLRERKDKTPFLVAIDGRCGAGKTTLAKEVQKKISCSVLHMDDFFLRPEQRTAERLSKPGENVDHERVKVVLESWLAGKETTYRPYDCQRQCLKEPVLLEKKDILLVEGSYSLTPSLFSFYDLRVFLDIDARDQLLRLERRVGKERLRTFVKEWIPLEEEYFQAFQIAEKCDVVFHSSESIH